MSNHNEATLVGFIGVTILLVAFVLNAFKFLRSDSYLYTSLNVVGASLACYSSYLIRFMPFVVLEGVWAVVALVALVRLVLSGGKRAAS